MLELRSSCEHCNKSLAANSTEARICSYECTFCQGCVDNILHNVCPNCGGGFSNRPIRPNNNWKNGNHLEANPSGSRIVYKPVNIEAHNAFSITLRKLAPESR